MCTKRFVLVVLLAAAAATPLRAQTRTHDQRLQVRERATHTGLKWGAIVGGIAGTLSGAYFGYLIDVICESECADDVQHGALVGGALGALTGAVAGGATGAMIGAGLPNWVNVDAARPASGQRLIGAATLLPALVRPQNGSADQPGVRATFAFQTSHFALGPEAGYYRNYLTQVGVNARLGTGVDKRIEPYVTAGGGFYSWRPGPNIGSTNLMGYSAGGGLHVRSADRKYGILAEARWQSNLSRSGYPAGKYGFTTIAAGGSLAW